MLAKHKANEVIAAIGRKGSGKSLLLKGLARRSKRVIVADVMAEYDNVLVVASPLALVAHIKKHPQFRVAVYPSGESDHETLCRIARAAGNTTLILEEVSHCCSPSSIGPEFKHCLLRGRHSRLNIGYSTQRFAEVHRTVTSQTDKFFLFAMYEPRDIVAVKERFGQDVAERVERLEPLHFIEVDSRRQSNEVYRVGSVGFSGGLVYHGKNASGNQRSPGADADE